ncbi:hypothetical protein E2C01_044929 [Portunus trituberculatus]|uniref:Uncharacterized protein n=1 Tax=Portunus trituberculatus TaxID=210409 RepID=A0A5B7FUC8_PORTR|nr:hypothetical protein [Portunus trituberculatus]
MFAEKEIVVPVSGEGRKGLAPLPPVSRTSSITPVSNASSTPLKKGPAPAVPTSITLSKPRAPSPVDLFPGNAVADESCNEQTSQKKPVVSCAVLTPDSPDAVIASIDTDATVIVRTPTPNPEEPPQSQSSVEKDSIVTYSGELVFLLMS